ncbi:MAG TPA: hypothetical protein VN729_05335, partial [Ktedonobacteraceae bacterium]|nr:hypothetical protein [Ktedonobacteraceae bacterium]
TATIIYAIPELACNLGDVITQAFPFLFSPDDLFPLINVLILWEEGESGIIYALEQQVKRDWSHLGAVSLSFGLGTRFIGSVNSVGLDTNETVLRRVIVLAAATIVDQVKHVESAKLHPLRVNLAGDSPQRIRSSDQAKAWRVDVTKSGAGWRLHYWHIPGPDGGSIEFSNVCKESDVTIYE